MKNWINLKMELLKDNKVASEYEKLSPKYDLISQLIEARIEKGLSQKDLAYKVGTKQSAISRLESGNSNPSLAFLEKIASVMGRKLVINIH